MGGLRPGERMPRARWLVLPLALLVSALVPPTASADGVCAGGLCLVDETSTGDCPDGEGRHLVRTAGFTSDEHCGEDPKHFVMVGAWPLAGAAYWDMGHSRGLQVGVAGVGVTWIDEHGSCRFVATLTALPCPGAPPRLPRPSQTLP